MTSPLLRSSTSTKASDQQHAGEPQRFGGAHQPGGERAVAGALDVRIEVAVGVVVDDAARRAREHHADDEDHQHVEVRDAVLGEPQRPQRGPQEQQGADRLVEAHEPFVRIQPLFQCHGPGSPECRRGEYRVRSKNGQSHFRKAFNEGLCSGCRWSRRPACCSVAAGGSRCQCAGD